MFMWYLGGGVGHRYIQGWDGTKRIGMFMEMDEAEEEIQLDSIYPGEHAGGPEWMDEENDGGQSDNGEEDDEGEDSDVDSNKDNMEGQDPEILEDEGNEPIDDGEEDEDEEDDDEDDEDSEELAENLGYSAL